jgi:transposase-like protein
MLENVKQVTIAPLIRSTIAAATVVYTNKHDIYARMSLWGYGRRSACHAAGEFARDEDGDGFCEVRINTREGFWSLLWSWLRPHRGASQAKLPLYPGFFELAHNVRKPGKAFLGASISLRVRLPPGTPDEPVRSRAWHGFYDPIDLTVFGHCVTWRTEVRNAIGSSHDRATCSTAVEE